MLFNFVKILATKKKIGQQILFYLLFCRCWIQDRGSGIKIPDPLHCFQFLVAKIGTFLHVWSKELKSVVLSFTGSRIWPILKISISIEQVSFWSRKQILNLGVENESTYFEF